ncbi:ArnT family glycosyltransferase [Mycolicibacterium brumae]|uniref:ArnT family glycosyltransferase n=1 Tax=Mycolicibacterium brumae TaxID=85968 RepID=UPI0035206577
MPEVLPPDAPCAPAPRRPRWERPALIVLLAGTAALYLWNLGASGWANGYYAAAVQAGTQNLTAWLFGSTDAANGITVDKTPAALWVMTASARLFGFNSWSMLVPQALMGVAAVALLWAAVRRISGPAPALLAGAALALTPAAALMFRFNNPDALLVLTMVGAAYATLRALDPAARAWWFPLAGALIGVGFLAKMAQGLLLVPVLAAVFWCCADLPWRTRLRRAAAAGAAATLSAGWYLLLVTCWPVEDRPYIGGSQHNSILELTFGYNGVGRITGAETGGLGNPNHDAGWARLLTGEMGDQIGWLLPSALIGLVAGLWLTRRAPRTDRTRAALLLWGGWLAVVGLTFSFAQGIVHPYYTVALAPAIGGGLATGVAVLWPRRGELPVAAALAAIVLAAAGMSVRLLAGYDGWLSWLRPTAAAAGALAALLLLLRTGRRWNLVVALALVAALAGPAGYSVATAATAHQGALPSAGPGGAHRGWGPPPGSFPSGPRSSNRPDHAGGGGFARGLLALSEPGPELTALVAAAAPGRDWAAAAIGSNNAAGYQLVAGAPVLAVGGFNGTDPAPTLEQFQRYVADGRIGYFIGSGFTSRPSDHGGSDAAARIAEWVAEHYPARTVDGVDVYDLRAHDS